jgi:predicted nucleic acid-binding protein
VDKTIVVNASPLIFLSRGKSLFLLHEFGQRVLVPALVANEIAIRGSKDITAMALAGTPWLEVVPSPATPEDVAAWGLGPGESAVISIAVAQPGMTAIIDDLCGRKCAASVGVPVRGTLGVVLAAKLRGIIPKARPVIEDMLAAGLYLRRDVLEKALKHVGE